MLKNFLAENIDYFEIIFISLSVISAFLSVYYLICRKSVSAFLKLLKLRKITGRVRNEKK